MLAGLSKTHVCKPVILISCQLTKIGLRQLEIDYFEWNLELRQFFAIRGDSRVGEGSAKDSRSET